MFFSDIHCLSGENLHVIFGNYSLPEDPTKVFSKGRVAKGYERKIFSLNQVLPKLDKWQDFLTIDRNKEQL